MHELGSDKYRGYYRTAGELGKDAQASAHDLYEAAKIVVRVPGGPAKVCT
jgi:hypothetical protein